MPGVLGRKYILSEVGIFVANEVSRVGGQFLFRGGYLEEDVALPAPPRRDSALRLSAVT